MKKKNNNILHFFVIAITVMCLVACSTTSRLEDGELLYTGVKKIEYLSDSGKVKMPGGIAGDISDAVDVPPNNYFSLLKWRYPFPLGLWVYNHWPNPEKGFKHWIYEKLVEEPVLVSDVRPEVRTHMIDQLLDNNGYFSGTATYELVQPRNKRKAAILYKVTPGKAYCLDRIELLPDTSHINHLIDSIASRLPYLSEGSQYCTDSLAAVRVAVTNSLRNRGYYFFQPGFLEFLADTVARPGAVQLRMVLGANIPKPAIEPYTTGDVTVYVYRNNGRAHSIDTIAMPFGRLIEQQPVRLRRSVITDNVTFKPGKIFSVRDMDRTQSYLSRLGIFSAINIETQVDTLADDRQLDVAVSCTVDRPLEASIEVNATSKSNSYIGPGIVLGVTNRNIFGGGEQFSVKLAGSYEWQTGGENKGGIFNSYEASLTASLAFPRLLAPGFIPRRRRQLNWTRFSLNADVLNRPHFFKLAQFNASMTYDWQATRRATMSFTPLKLTYTKLMHTTFEFDSIMAENQAVAQSFRSQFIPQMIYAYNYERRYGKNNILNFSFSAQEAGNICWAIYEACGKKDEKKLFGTPLSQFVKGQMQIVYNRRVFSGDHWLVMRGAVGAAHAYGNSSQVPYAEQFYCGGANSVRAFTVRSIGPGSYHVSGDRASDYFDQTGTFKFEANAEYRFPIFGPVHGAVFLDSGNVWLLKNDPQRPGGKLKGSTFFKDLALGTGVGLRLDISMLVLRGDLGIGIHAPYDTGRRGYYNMTSFGKSLAFHLAIGYPF